MELPEIAQHVLADVSYVLTHIPKANYTRPIDLLSSATIGKHTRHLIEFFQCLLSQHQEGTICYDKRERNTQIEENPIYAAAVIDNLSKQLPQINGSQPLTLSVDYSDHGKENIFIPTSFDRELIYNIDHAIHHLAIIKIGLKIVSPDLILPTGFGVNPSTLRYQGAKS